MPSMMKLVGLSMFSCSLAAGAALAGQAPVNQPVAKAGKALAEACADECYLDLASADGSLRTVLVRNGAAIAAPFAFEIIARGERTEWEGIQVTDAGVSPVVGWKEHAEVGAMLVAGKPAYRTELNKVKAFVRRDQVAADAGQTELQRAVIKYLVALGYVGL